MKKCLFCGNQKLRKNTYDSHQLGREQSRLEKIGDYNSKI